MGRGTPYDDVDTGREWAELCCRGQLLEHGLGSARRDRESLDDLHAGSECNGAFTTRRVETPQGDPTTQRDHERERAEYDKTRLERRSIDEHRSEQCPDHHRRHRQCVEDPHDAAQEIGLDDPRDGRFGDDFTRHHTDATQQCECEREGQLVGPGVRELSEAEHDACRHHDERHSPTCRQSPVDGRAEHPTDPGRCQEVAVSFGAEPEFVLAVEHQLYRLGAVCELGHCHDDEQRDDEWRRPSREEPSRQLSPGTRLLG